MSLELRFWGVRGSVPAPGPATTRVGGNTTCVSVRKAGESTTLVLDGGTGIRVLGEAMLADGPVRAELLLSHTHWDHIQGLPFFAPLYRPDSVLRVWAAGITALHHERTLRTQMDETVFPVSLQRVAAAVSFSTMAPELPAIIGDTGIEATAFAARHPGGAVAYRLESEGAGSIVFAPDNELSGPVENADYVAWRSEFARRVRGARLLVHDATYTAEEYERQRGWGHTSQEDAVRFAVECEVQQLALFHHHPDRDDETLYSQRDACAALARSLGSSLEVVLAVEGMAMVV
jgi:phosphoribosyl 1,2-cyclic phosphodiesterase